ncbi:DUF4350 domain-containing protein [Roseibacillus persicicus]|uniref:DUF4350 domain-containing protein n=1 Tax=Roseibacillus persicicus TaxID=454148 RepID=UPI00398B9077
MRTHRFTLKRVLLLLVTAFLLAGCGKYEEREREVGYKGLARINHLLAAERMATQMGLKASSYAGAPVLPPPYGTVLVLPAASLQSEGILEEISDWVDQGGNLIVYLTLQNEGYDLFSGTDQDPPFQAFLDYFALDFDKQPMRIISREEGESGKSERVWGEKIEWVDFVREDSYQTDYHSPYLLTDLDYAEDEASAFQSYDYGLGHLTVLGSAELFTNKHLGKAEHATLLWDILTVGEGDTVWFVHSTRVSFFSLLWQRAPEALIFSLVTLALLVWWAAKGVGPRFVRGTNPSAKLDEHLEASGAFFLKHKAEGVVVSRLREKLFHRLARATNQPFNASQEELLTAARAQGILAESEVTALTSPTTNKSLLSTLQTLKTLDKKL